MSEPAGGKSSARAAPGPAIGLLALAVLLFGAAWPVTKFALAGASPVWFAAGRAGLGALASFVLLAALGRLRLPASGDWPVVASIGGLQLAAFFAFTHLGLAQVPAGRSVVLAYTTALWLVPLAGFTGEAVAGRRLWGAGLGLAGIALLVDPLALDWRRPGTLAGYGWLLLASLAWAVAIFHARRHRWRGSPFDLLPWQLTLAGALLLPLALWFEPEGGIGLGAPVLGPLLFLGVLAGPLATWAANWVSRLLPTVASSTGFLGVPVVGIGLSVLWLGEPLAADLLGGAALVALGVLLATPGLGREARAADDGSAGARP